MSKKIMITGAGGFIGSSLIRKILEKGWQVKVLFHHKCRREYLEGLDIELVYGDILHKKTLIPAVKDVQLVYHLAGLVQARNLEEFRQVNVIGYKNLLDTISEVNPNIERVLFLSSQAAAGPAHSLDLPKKETDPDQPVSDYGISKMEAERMAEAYYDKLPITTLRPSPVYGPRDKEFLRYFKLVKNWRIKAVIGNGKNYVNLIHVYDLIDAIIFASISENTIGKKYFIAEDRIFSWREVGDLIEKVVGKKSIYIPIPGFLARLIGFMTDIQTSITHKSAFFSSSKIKEALQKYWICSVEAAKQDFGFNTRYHAELGMKQTYDWYIDNKWL